MRSALLAAGLLVAVVGLAAGWGRPAEPVAGPQTEWVRTIDGWEPLDTLLSRPRSGPTVHPAVVAGLQLMASLWVLVAASARE